MEHDSTLLLELYRAARTLPAGEFPDLALGLVQAVLPFDSARLMTVEFTGDAAQVRASLTYHEAADSVLDWAAIHRHDPVMAALRSQPGRVVSFHTPTLFRAPQRSILRDYAERYRHQDGLSMLLPEADSGYTDALSFFRARDDIHFDARAQCLMRQLMPHLLEALKLNRQLAAGAAPGAHGALIIARLDGTVQYCAPQCSQLLALEWHDWHASRLPAALLAALARPGASGYAGARVMVTASRIKQLLLLRVQRQSPLAQLSPREREVACLYAQGKSSKVIAAQLGLAPATVRNLVQRIYLKLEVGDKGALASLLAGLPGPACDTAPQ
jgi:DNA-binding CsgD family transcriptional regulator